MKSAKTGSARVTLYGKTSTFYVDEAKIAVTPGRRFDRRNVFTVTVTLPDLKPITYPEIQNPEWPHAGGKPYTAEEAAQIGFENALDDLEQDIRRARR